MALFFALVLTMNFYRPRHVDGSWQAQWRFRDWRFGPYETRQPFTVAPVSGYVRSELQQTFIFVTKGYRFGPLHVFSNWSEPGPQRANAPPRER